MATVEQCERAFGSLAAKLSSADAATRDKAALNRSVSCELRDLDVTFGGQLRDGALHDVRQVAKSDAQIKLAMSSDDLIALTDGQLNLVQAWASGRVKIEASVFDLLKLRSAFS
jgi:alkyl sulfatase BDS1-like metallo-beta-lactamase superfamily hydrolase